MSPEMWEEYQEMLDGACPLEPTSVYEKGMCEECWRALLPSDLQVITGYKATRKRFHLKCLIERIDRISLFYGGFY
jgi:hypothetical protein